MSLYNSEGRKKSQKGAKPMDDDTIVSLYWKRDESAISATEKKYGRYLLKIAYNILIKRP